jgi:hypothetical protein
LACFEDQDIGIGIFPKREEVLECGAGFAVVAVQNIGSGKTKVGQGTCRKVCEDGAVIYKLLKFCRCSRSVV